MCLTQRSGNWHVDSPSPNGARGPVGETLALQVGPVGETIAKHDILL
jgi:hypothetical protein